MTPPSPTFAWLPHVLNRRDRLIAGGVFFGVLGVLLGTMQMGFTRDEGFYFHAAYQYVGWFEELWRNLLNGKPGLSFEQTNIDKHWSYNPEHPVLMKTLFALSYKLFHDTLGWVSASTAMRIPGAMMASALMAGVYLFGRQLIGRAGGLIAVTALLFQPRFFFHAHLACFDVAITAMWFWVVYAYWRSYESRRWIVWTGILFGLALSTKLNAFFLPIVLGMHWLLAHIRDFRISWVDQTLKFHRPSFPWVFVSMGLIGPALFLALWPRHWFDTVARIQWYLNFHLTHEHYFVNYFGQNLQNPPFPISFPWVMTLVTVPATLLLAFVIGVGYFLHRQINGLRKTPKCTDRSERPLRYDSRSTALLFAINSVFPIVLISLPHTPIFGGTKHWMPAMPFVAIVAAGGIVWAAKSACLRLQELYHWPDTPRLRFMTTVVVASFAIIPAIYATAYNHPYGTSYYNELIGSYRGAADREMMRQFWGYASREALPFMNDHAEHDSHVWTHNTVRYAWDMYQRDELTRMDLHASTMESSQWALYHQQKAFVFLLLPLWENYGTQAPSHVVSIDGVPLLSVYERPALESFKHPQHSGQRRHRP